MDKITYLQKKAELKEQALKTFKREDFCYQCFRNKPLCLCHLIKQFDPQFEFVLLIHPMEAKKEKMGTGRLTHAFLQNSKLIAGVDFTNNEEVNSLINNHHCYVMYPGDEAINVSSGDTSTIKNKLLAQEKIIIFLIDGTWPCAKKMMKLSTNLHLLPRISFDVKKESMFAIKEQPSKYCLSTIESIHLFLSECEKKKLIELNGQHDQMLVAFQAMIDYQIQCASDESMNSYRRKSKSGYTLPSERTPSKKWETRSIIFRGK